jgi:hypothetical protein
MITLKIMPTKMFWVNEKKEISGYVRIRMNRGHDRGILLAYIWNICLNPLGKRS